MGKTKKPRNHRPTLDPIGILNAAADEELEPRANPVEAIREQLQSANADDKMCGLQTLSLLAQNEARIKAILGSDLVRITAPLLVDMDQNIRHSAAGALRNLSAVSIDVCETLVELDVATPLLVLLNQFAASPDWKPEFDKDGGLDQRSDIFLQAVNIIWNLCESTSLALETFNQSQLLRSFVKCLNYEVYGMEIAISVAQALLVISEDNSAAWEVLVGYTNDFLTLLTLDGSHSKLTLAAFSAGIVANVPVLSSAHSQQILQTISRVIEVNARQILNEMSSKLPLDTQDPQDLELELTDEAHMEDESPAELEARRRKLLPSAIDIEIRDIELLLLAQRIAAEILTNICCAGDDFSDSEDMEDSEAESVHDYDTSAGRAPESDKLSVEIIEALKTFKIVEKLWQRAERLPENVHALLHEHKLHGRNLLKRFLKRRTSILVALQTLCNVLTTEDLGGAEPVYRVWLQLGQQVFQGAPDTAEIEATTGLMRATLDHLRAHRELFAQMTAADLDLVLKGIEKYEDPETRANWYKMLGVLGCVLPETLVRVILTFMVDACAREDDCWTLSEGMDAFMDIFADNDWPNLIRELQLTRKCKEIEKTFKAKVRQNKKALSDRYGTVNTVRSNLARFCKYLEQQEKTKP